MIELTIYGEPVGKARPRFATGHAYTPEKTKYYEEIVRSVYRNKYGDTIFDKDIPLRMEIWAFFGVPKSDRKSLKWEKLHGRLRPTKRPDMDNIIKCVADAGNGVMYYDDSQVVEVTAEKWYSDKPRVELRISEIENG